MKSYAKPVVLANDEVAEGVYAGSGKLPDCWTVSCKNSQEWSGSHHIFEVHCEHNNAVKHISGSTTVELTFSTNLTDAYSEFPCSFSGNKVTITRDLLADAYQSGDSVTYKVWVKAADEASTRAITCANATIKCQHETNVQGELD